MSKLCKTCGARVDDQVSYCPSCGSTDLVGTAINNNEQAQQQGQAQTVPPINDPVVQGTNVEASVESVDGNGNILAGIVGAFLFSIIGGLLYFVIYQLGIIAGICGLVIFVLANFGYGLFAKTKNKDSIVGVIVAIAATVIMIFLAEYFCISFEIFQVYKDQGITIFDAVRATPEFLVEPEIAKAVAGDLAFAYIFGFIATIGNIVSIAKKKKRNNV